MCIAQKRTLAFVFVATAAAFVQAQPQDDQNRASKSNPQNTAPSAKASNGPQKYIKISKETTYFTKPLDKRGYVNYIEALNDTLKPKGVTPKNNAYVLLWKTIGPFVITEDFTRNLGQKLGVKPPPKQGNYFIDIDQYISLKQKEMGLKANSNPGIELQDELLDQYFTTIEQPWKVDRFPMMADMIKRNSEPLKLVKQATERPHFYRPSVSALPEDERELLIAALLTDINRFRSIGRLMASRAMLHVANGDDQAAQSDLLAIHKLARKLGQQSTLSEQTIGIGIEDLALRGDRQLAFHGNLAADEFDDYRKQLQSLPQISNMQKSINQGERATTLDCLVLFARANLGDPGTHEIDTLFDMVYMSSNEAAKMKSWFSMPLDWNEVLRTCNQRYDRLAEISVMPFQERKKELEKLEQEVERIKQDIKFDLITAKAMKQDLKQRSRTIFDVYMVMANLPSSIVSCIGTQDRSTMTKRLTELTFSLQAYREDHGSYPQTLSALKPNYATKIPQDVFGKTPLKYSSDGMTFTLYSVGTNGIDDGGKSYNDGENTDDIVVKSPGWNRSKKLEQEPAEQSNDSE